MIAKVASVWIISVAVCLPLLVMGFVDRSTVYNGSTCAPAAKQVGTLRGLCDVIHIYTIRMCSF